MSEPATRSWRACPVGASGSGAPCCFPIARAATAVKAGGRRACPLSNLHDLSAAADGYGRLHLRKNAVDHMSTVSPPFNNCRTDAARASRCRDPETYRVVCSRRSSPRAQRGPDASGAGFRRARGGRCIRSYPRIARVSTAKRNPAESCAVPKNGENLERGVVNVAVAQARTIVSRPTVSSLRLEMSVP